MSKDSHFTSKARLIDNLQIATCSLQNNPYTGDWLGLTIPILSRQCIFLLLFLGGGGGILLLFLPHKAPYCRHT